MPASLSSSDGRRTSTLRMEECFFRVVCWIPLTAFMALIGFAAIAAVRFGHWPQPANPDPKDLSLPILHAAALLAYPLALISIPTCLLLVILAWRSVPRRDVVLVAIGVSLWAFILPITGSLFTWLID